MSKQNKSPLWRGIAAAGACLLAAYPRDDAKKIKEQNSQE